MSLTLDSWAVLRHDVARQRRQGDGHKHHEQAGNLVLLLRTDVFCTDQSKASAVERGGSRARFSVVRQRAQIKSQ